MKKTDNKKNIIIKNVCIVLLALIIIFFVITAGFFTGMYTAASREIKGMNIQEIIQNKYSVSAYENAVNSDNPSESDTFWADDPDEEYDWTWTESEDIPKLMKDAVVAVEDENFYLHKGFDPEKSGSRTITQQLIKYVMNDENDSRRLKTIIRSVLFEKKMTKDEILTAYMNAIYFADNCYGVHSVASAYYNVDDLQDLTLAQIAAIAGMIQNPLESEPFNHSYENIERRNYTLRKMYNLGKITKSEYENSIAEGTGIPEEDYYEEVIFSPAPSSSPSPSSSPASSRNPN